MSLTAENFDEMAKARKRWLKKGLSYREARERLANLDSTVYPIAVHCAQFISDNWSRERVKKLTPEYRVIYNRALEDIH